MMILRLLLLLTFTTLGLSQNPSPCPETFSYEPRGTEDDRWYGVIALRSSDDLTGIWLHIGLDSPADLLGNWFGDTSSSDNQEFSIRNLKYKLQAGPPVAVRFFVKYDPAKTIPSLQTIRLNGKTICSAHAAEHELRPTQPTLHISQNRPTEANVIDSNRPSGSNEAIFSRPSSGEESSNGSILDRNSDKSHIGILTRPPSESTSIPIHSNSGENTNGQFSNNRLNFNNNGENTNGQFSNNRPDLTNNRENTNGQFLNNRPDSNNNRSSSKPTSGSVGLVLTDNDGESENEDFFPGDFANIGGPLLNRPSASRPSGISARNSQCGTIASRPRPLISSGQDTAPGQWPWHVAVYHSKGIQLMYTCGATLISEQYIVTAAHCVTKPHTSRIVDPASILVYLGKYNLVTFGPEVQDRDVENIYVHPQFNSTVYFNDIAVVKLSRPVEITNYVRPCCLWEEDTELDDIIEQQGTVVGWGFDETKKLSNKLMQAQMPIVSTVKCIYSNRDFFSQFTFEKNYCAGFRNGTSVCNGDSGGGMVFPRKGTTGQNTIWQLRGLVSVGVALQGQGICDTSQYIVFTDVAKHISWIKQIMAN